MFPGVLQALKSLYWGYSRNPRFVGHRLHVFWHLLRSLTVLWTIRIVHCRRKLVLIGLVERMGDIVAAEPVSRIARQRFPDAHIVWVVAPAYRDLVERFEAVDRGLTVSCITEWLLLIVLRPPCTIWNLHISGAVCSKCRAPLPQYGDAAGITMDTYYDMENLLAVSCRCAGIPVIDETPRLSPGAAAVRAVDALRLPGRYVVLHCASDDSSRNWRAAGWDELARFISGTLGFGIVEIGLNPVTDGAKSGRYVNLCGKTSLLETAEVIRRAALFIGLDSGPAHIANAVGTPGVLLFGRFLKWNTYMAYSGSYKNGGADVLRAEGPASNLPIGVVKDAVERRLAAVRAPSAASAAV